MPKRKTVVDFDEVFAFAKEKHGIDWNPCCEMFHAGAILCNDEGKNRTIYLEEVESNLKYDEEHPDRKYKYSEEHRKGWEIVVEFMKENNLEEMYVDND